MHIYAKPIQVLSGEIQMMIRLKNITGVGNISAGTISYFWLLYLFFKVSSSKLLFDVVVFDVERYIFDRKQLGLCISLLFSPPPPARCNAVNASSIN